MREIKARKKIISKINQVRLIRIWGKSAQCVNPLCSLKIYFPKFIV